MSASAPTRAAQRASQYFAGGRSALQYCVYILNNDKGATYVGYSSSPRRRLLQHNGERNGGANRTKRGRPWRLACFVRGFSTEHNALAFEFAMNNPYDIGLKRGEVLPPNPTGSLDSRLRVLVLFLSNDRYYSQHLRLSLLNVASDHDALTNICIPVDSLTRQSSITSSTTQRVVVIDDS